MACGGGPEVAEDIIGLYEGQMQGAYTRLQARVRNATARDSTVTAVPSKVRQRQSNTMQHTRASYKERTRSQYITACG